MTLDVIVGLATLSIENIRVNEADGVVTVTVTLDEEVSERLSAVDIITTDGSATAGEDYTAVSSQTLNFSGTTGGETQTFNVPIIDDAIYDGGVNGDDRDPDSLAGQPGQDRTNVDISNIASIFIIDNDYEVVLTMGDIDIRVSEGDGVVATVTVSLNASGAGQFQREPH